MIIDHHAHWYTRAYLDSIKGRKKYPRSERVSGGYRFFGLAADDYFVRDEQLDFAANLQDMDEHGVDVAVISPNMFGEVSGLELSEARDMLDLINGETARVQAAHPDRVVGLAMLPMRDAEASVEILDDAIGHLGLRGVCVLSNTGGDSIASAATLPIYQRIASLSVPVFLHPSHHSMLFGAGYDPVIETGLSWMSDSSVAALALMFSGILDACPGLTVVHPHLGGTLPYVIGRVEAIARDRHREGPTVSEYIRRHFYADSVGVTVGALDLAVNLYGLERMLFGTDHPWRPRKIGFDFVAGNAAPEMVHAIVHENAIPGFVPRASQRPVG